nr:biotin/lipoyl-binding protein [Saprospiraceae bacterium]
MKKIKLLLLFLGFSMLLFQACGTKEENGSTTKPEENKNISPDSLGVNNKVMGVARIEPVNGITKLSAGEAGKIMDVFVRDNQVIKAGQALFILDAQIEEAQLKQTKSIYESQKLEISANKIALKAVNTRAENIKNKLERAEAQYAAKAITENELVNIRYEWNEMADEKAQAQNKIQQAESRLKEIQSDISYQQTLINKKTIKSPLSGLVLNTLVKKGNY